MEEARVVREEVRDDAHAASLNHASDAEYSDRNLPSRHAPLYAAAYYHDKADERA